MALTNDGIRVEATATPRVGVYRFMYAEGKPVKLLVDLQWVNAGNMRNAVVEFANALGADGRSFSGGRRTHAWLRRSVYWKVMLVQTDGGEDRAVCRARHVAGVVAARLLHLGQEHVGGVEADPRGRCFLWRSAP